MRFRFDKRSGEVIGTDLLCSVAAAVAGSAAIGAVGNIVSSSMASGSQQNAAQQANSEQMQMFNIEQQNLAPYINAGSANLYNLQNLTGTLPGGSFNALNAPLMQSFQPTEAQLEATPGYQFNLTQGLKATQNNATANGVGVSGNALAAASQYATGLADSTYQNQFSNYVTNQTNQFNRLLSLANLGQNSAANVGQGAIQTGANIGSNLIGAGNAAAAGTLGIGNAISNGVSGLSSAYLLNNLNNQNNGMLTDGQLNNIANGSYNYNEGYNLPPELA